MKTVYSVRASLGTYVPHMLKIAHTQSLTSFCFARTNHFNFFFLTILRNFKCNFRMKLNPGSCPTCESGATGAIYARFTKKTIFVEHPHSLVKPNELPIQQTMLQVTPMTNT